MSGIKLITSYFKVRSKDELEVDELLLSQVARHSRAASLEHALTISTVSSKVMSIGVASEVCREVTGLLVKENPTSMYILGLSTTINNTIMNRYQI